MTDIVTQSAPYPEALALMVKKLVHRPGWTFELHEVDRDQGCVGLTLSIYITTVNSYNHDEIKRIHHLMPVPTAAYDDRSWQRWLFDQCSLVDLHESAEFFTINGTKPYAPSHGPGNNPYLIRELGTEIDIHTDFRGGVNE